MIESDAQFSNLKVDSLVSGGELSCQKLQTDFIEAGVMSIGEEKEIQQILITQMDADTETVESLITGDLTVASNLVTQNAVITGNFTIEGQDPDVGKIWTCTSESGTGSWKFADIPDGLQEIFLVNTAGVLNMGLIPSGSVIQLNLPNSSVLTVNFPLNDTRSEVFWKIIGGTNPGSEIEIVIETNGQEYMSNVFRGIPTGGGGQNTLLSNQTSFTTPTVSGSKGSSINLDVYRRENQIYITGNAFLSTVVS